MIFDDDVYVFVKDDDDDNEDDDDDYDDDDDFGLPAHSHHDKIPPWWKCASNEHGWILSPAYSYHW